MLQINLKTSLLIRLTTRRDFRIKYYSYNLQHTKLGMLTKYNMTFEGEKMSRVLVFNTTRLKRKIKWLER